jgi:hypothetical protein
VRYSGDEVVDFGPYSWFRSFIRDTNLTPIGFRMRLTIRGEEIAFQSRKYQHVLVACQTYCAWGVKSSGEGEAPSFSLHRARARSRSLIVVNEERDEDDDEHDDEPVSEGPGAIRDKALFSLMRCPYCRTSVTGGAISCPTCRAQISYGCSVPATGCLLAVVVAFLAGSALIGLCSPGESAGDGKLSQNLLLEIGVFSALLGLGLWLLMCRVAKRFVSFAPKRQD